MDRMINMWESVFREIEWHWPHLYNDIVDWYPSAQMEITFKTSNGNKYAYNWVGHTIMNVYSADEDLNMDEDEWRRKFSKKLFDKMCKLGISQDELSIRTGISRVMINRYMNGKASPSGYNIEKIAKALKCSASELTNFNRVDASRT